MKSMTFLTDRIFLISSNEGNGRFFLQTDHRGEWIDGVEFFSPGTPDP
jgi:hypothetical protein